MRYIKISKYTKGFGEWPSKVPPNKRPKAETELPYQHIRVQILRLMKCKLHISNYCFFMALFYPVQHNLLPYSTYSIGENFQEKEKQPNIWTSLMFLLLFFFPMEKMLSRLNDCHQSILKLLLLFYCKFRSYHGSKFEMPL